MYSREGLIAPCNTPASLAHEYEGKFVLPRAHAPAARRIIESFCDFDSNFPEGIISSIYFDTPALTFLHEKINSDYLKTKVRVRWYSERDGTPQSPRPFLEVKYRIGSTREKIHVEAPFDIEWLKRAHLSDRAFLQVNRELQKMKVMLPGEVLPLMEISYHRIRFRDRSSGLRIALDTDITCPRTSSLLFPLGQWASRDRTLPTAVVEVKGSSGALPRPLQPLFALGLQKSSFSKYWEAYNQFL